MDGAEVKGGADVRFAMQGGNSGKTVAAGAAENRADYDFNVVYAFGTPTSRRRWVKIFFWSLVAGVLTGIAGLAVWFFADIPAGWVFALLSCALLLTVYGGFLWVHFLHFDEVALDVCRYRNNAEEEIAHAKRNLRGTTRACKEREAGLVEIEEEKERLRSAVKDMREKMEISENAAAAKYKELEREKEKVDIKLICARQTLEYYMRVARLDVYSGADALRECGGIYVVKNIGDGKVKIGITADNFARRFKEIRGDCVTAGIKKEDVVPEILVPLDEGKAEVEKDIHLLFADRKTAGEWFKVSPERAVATVLRFVNDKRKGNFERRSKLSIYRDMPEE